MPAPRPRDSDGIRVPSPGTQSFEIYCRLKDGMNPTEIAHDLGIPRPNVTGTLWEMFGRHRGWPYAPRKAKKKKSKTAPLTRRRPRDDEGFLIPAEGTLSRAIYELRKSGATATETAQELGIRIELVSAQWSRIRNPDRAAKRNKEYASR